MSNYYLIHRGVSVLNGAPGIGSGRYPLGFGDRPWQRRKEKAKKIAVGVLKMSGKLVATVAVSYASTYLVGKLGLTAVHAIVNHPPLSEMLMPKFTTDSGSTAELARKGFEAVEKILERRVGNIESMASGYADLWKRVLNDRKMALGR